MRINRFDTKAYVISAEGEAEALKYFNERAKKMEASYKSKVKTSLDYRYTPLLVVGAIKRDKDGKGTLIEGMENTFHIGLRDGCFYIFGKKGFADSAKGTLIKSHDINLERVDLLLDIATLSPKALNTLGMLLDRGTLNFEELDIPTQTAAKELNGRKYEDIYRPVDREGDLTKAVKEIFEMTPVTPIYKISPKLPTPRFTDSSYNLSPHLKITEYIEDDVELEKVVRAPDKLMYILGTLFNCKLTIKRITYMRYIECTFAWEGKQSSQIKYIACKKSN